MLVVRNCFVAKPGNASKLAAQLKEASTSAKIPRSRVLTDLTGEFNRVILEYEVESIAEFEAQMNAAKGVMRKRRNALRELAR